MGTTGLRLLAAPTYIVDGNLSVKLKRASGEVFVWKKNEVPASPERLQELLGYNIYPPFLGYVDGHHPRTALSTDT